MPVDNNKLPAKKRKKRDAKPAKKMGRPLLRSADLIDTICDRLANGESLVKICGDPAIPSTSLVHNWLAEDDDFLDRYTRAREAQADRIAEEVVEILDGPVKTELELAHRIARAEAHKWHAGKLKGQYSDKKGPETAVQVNIQQTADQYFEGMEDD